MIQISPSENFPIVRVLGDHTDNATYYVQAVVRDASTDVVLATVNLTDRGNRRFSKLYKVPSDNTYSRGSFLVITTTIYTDAGYTTKSPNYQEVADTYVVQQRWNPLIGGATFGGGTDGMSLTKEEYAKMALMFEDTLNKKFPISEPRTEIAAPSLPQLTLQDIEKIVEKHKAPPVDFSFPAFPDLTPHFEKISKSISNFPKPDKFQPTDLSPVLNALQEMSALHPAIEKTIKESNQSLVNYFDQNKKAFMAEIAAIVTQRLERIKQEESQVVAQKELVQNRRKLDLIKIRHNL